MDGNELTFGSWSLELKNLAKEHYVRFDYKPIHEAQRTGGRKSMHCFFCKGEIETSERIGREEDCPHCGRPLKCCLQCKFYDPHAYNECREVAADRVLDKERANFCDYFVPRGASRGSINKKVEARKALEALFKK
jgi:hypothetical protein